MYNQVLIYFSSSDIGYNSDTSPIPTPYIDSLARGSNAVQFSQYYVNSLCSPTRASLLTGRYSINAGIPYVIVPGLWCKQCQTRMQIPTVYVCRRVSTGIKFRGWNVSNGTEESSRLSRCNVRQVSLELKHLILAQRNRSAELRVQANGILVIRRSNKRRWAEGSMSSQVTHKHKLRLGLKSWSHFIQVYTCGTLTPTRSNSTPSHGILSW